MSAELINKSEQGALSINETKCLSKEDFRGGEYNVRF